MSIWQKIKDSTTIDEKIERAVSDAETLPRMALLLKYYKAIFWSYGSVCLVVGLALGILYSNLRAA